ncbi:MAG: hypothetical protein J5814_00080 [Bacteroidaceae bacterium]|nr:hypothetical protein [Bacteroidaceae bacterium]
MNKGGEKMLKEKIFFEKGKIFFLSTSRRMKKEKIAPLRTYLESHFSAPVNPCLRA